jgi:transposase
MGVVVRSAGAALFFLPPYSSDLGPIERAFAELNAVVRAAPQSFSASSYAIATAVTAISPRTRKLSQERGILVRV